nr:hypothetical protein [Streptomyces tsukubensis NRRL18488]
MPYRLMRLQHLLHLVDIRQQVSKEFLRGQSLIGPGVFVGDLLPAFQGRRAVGRRLDGGIEPGPSRCHDLKCRGTEPEPGSDHTQKGPALQYLVCFHCHLLLVQRRPLISGLEQFSY